MKDIHHCSIDEDGVTFNVTSSYSPPDEVFEIIESIRAEFSISCTLIGGNNDVNELYFKFDYPIDEERMHELHKFVGGK